MRARARQMAAQLAQMTDADELGQALAAMEQQAGQVPPQMKPMFEYLKRRIQARLAEVQGGSSAGAEG
jgi:hypothetical protein